MSRIYVWLIKFVGRINYDFIEMKDKLFKFELITQGLEGQIMVKGAVDFDPDYNFGQEELKC